MMIIQQVNFIMITLKVLTITFMKTARAANKNDPFKWGDFTSYIFGLLDNLSDFSIETSAI